MLIHLGLNSFLPSATTHRLFHECDSRKISMARKSVWSKCSLGRQSSLHQVIREILMQEEREENVAQKLKMLTRPLERKETGKTLASNVNHSYYSELIA